MAPVCRARQRARRTPAQGGSAYSPAGFLLSAASAPSAASAAFLPSAPSAAFAPSAASAAFGPSAPRRFVATQRGLPACGTQGQGPPSRVPEYFQNRIALKQRTVENAHSQRFQKLPKGSRAGGACYSTRLSTSWSNFPSVLPSFLRMTVLGSLRTKLRVLPLSFLRVMVSPLSATTVNPPV